MGLIELLCKLGHKEVQVIKETYIVDGLPLMRVISYFCVRCKTNRREKIFS